MKSLLKYMMILLFTQLLVVACKEEEAELGAPPTEEDAKFTFTPSEENANIINFKSPSSAFLKKWSFGNGGSSEGSEVQAVYPFKGEYQVTLTVYTSGGSTSTTQTIVIENTDLTLLDPIYELLVGGENYPNGKQWVVDKARKGHMGVGPVAGRTAEWWEAGPNEKDGSGMYDDKYQFFIEDHKFVHTTNGQVFINTAQGPNFPGAFANAGDMTAPYEAPDNLSWTFGKSGDNYTLRILNGGFIGYYTGVSTYDVITVTENELYLRYTDAANGDLAWYMRLIPEGFTPPPPPPPLTAALPLTFEGEKPPFDGFGGSTFDVVNNPSATGINTSAKVGELKKGSETWAGIVTNLSAKIDFSSANSFKLKIYSPKTGVAKLKIEEQANSNSSKEIDVQITKVNQWEELTFDFSDTESNKFDRMAIFFDFGSPEQNTFYFDDVRLVNAGCADVDAESTDPAAGLSFTIATANFGEFGGLASEKIDNPFKTGINTSCYVNSYTKLANCQTWSGVGYLLANPIDFATTTKKKFKIKVYAVNQATTVTLRLERLAHPNTEPSAERNATISATGQWEELTFDFSDITDPNTYQNIIVYFEKGAACDGDQYYFDDLIQYQ